MTHLRSDDEHGLPEHADSIQQSTCSLIVWQGICLKYQSLWYNVCIQHSLSWAFFVLGVFCSGSWQSWITCSKRRASRRTGQWSAVLVGPFQLLVLIPTCLFPFPMLHSFWLLVDVHHYSDSQYPPFFSIWHSIRVCWLSWNCILHAVWVIDKLPHVEDPSCQNVPWCIQDGINSKIWALFQVP